MNFELGVYMNFELGVYVGKFDLPLVEENCISEHVHVFYKQ